RSRATHLRSASPRRAKLAVLWDPGAAKPRHPPTLGFASLREACGLMGPRRSEAAPPTYARLRLAARSLRSYGTPARRSRAPPTYARLRFAARSLHGRLC